MRHECGCILRITEHIISFTERGRKASLLSGPMARLANNIKKYKLCLQQKNNSWLRRGIVFPA